MTHTGFILSSNQVFNNDTTQLVFQGRLSDGQRFHWTVTQPLLVFFINRDEKWTPPGALRKSVELSNLRGDPVDALYFRNTGELNRARYACNERGISTYEADVNTLARFLMEHFIRGGVTFEGEPDDVKGGVLYFTDPIVKPSDFTPKLKLLSFDIETSLKLDLYSISLYGEALERVLMVDPACSRGTQAEGYEGFRNERDLLDAFSKMVREYDPDAFIGWNVVGFDLQWLSRKCQSLGIQLDIGVDGPAELLAPDKISNQWIARIPGRAVLDGIAMVRAAFVQTEDYSLATVAHEILGRKKLIEKTGREKTAEITRQFHKDKASLARYNLEDARMVYEIFGKLNLASLAMRRSQLTGLALDRTGGSVAAFDFLYLPRLHRRGYVADSFPQPTDEVGATPGGLVLDSTPGFYRNVAVFDFKSLYPSIISTFRVDPLAANVVLHNLNEDSETAGRIVKGPEGLEFAEEFTILPAIIDELWQERDRAKQMKDTALSQAVKIIMNSFYGVLGSPDCRFYDPRLAGTITRNGHWILKFSREFIENNGYRVIYGDTDSLFVQIGDEKDVMEIGAEISGKLNRYLDEELLRRFEVNSRLVIEFEKMFTRFFMPTVRGRDTGSKKRYAGLLTGESGESKLHFVGMESSRRDWTALAKELQADLFSLLFREDESEDLKADLAALVCARREQLFNGELDDKLVYRKGISKRLEDYTKNAPPHVRAARMLDELDGRVVRYVMTNAGPEPIQKRSRVPLDYNHYSEKQLAPVADMVLRFFDMDYRTVTMPHKQLNLF